MTTAELIVRTLQLVSGNCPTLEELGSEQLTLADEINARYQKYSRFYGSFAEADRRSRVEVVQEILDRAKEAGR